MTARPAPAPSAPAGLWLAALALAWLAGVGVQLQASTLMPIDAVLTRLAAAGAAAGLALILGRRVAPRCPWLAPAAAALASGSLGFALTTWQAHQRGDDALARDLEGVDLVLVGVVASLPQPGLEGTRFRFDVASARREGEPVRVPPRISMGWYDERGESASLASAPDRTSLRAGQRWQFTARLKRPHGLSNPGGFDYELWLYEQGLRATGAVRPRHGGAVLLDESVGAAVERWRQGVRDAIMARVSDPRAAGVLAALAIGDQGAIERADWEVFRATGIAHLVSISGLHVTMFGWLAGLIVGALWRRAGSLPLWLPAPQAARTAALAAAAAYAVLSGWGVPAQRTVWMLATAYLIQISGRRWPWTLVLLASAVVVTALDPWALLQPGFWLSFTAVGLLLASEPVHGSRDGTPAAPDAAGSTSRRPSVTTVPAVATDSVAPPSRLRMLAGAVGDHGRNALRTQLVATLGLAPLTLVYFQQLSLVGFLANLVAIPVVTLLITPLALLGLLVAPLWTLGAGAVSALVAFLGMLAAWPGAVWTVPAAPLWAQIAGLLGAAIALLPLPWTLRALAPLLVVPLLWPVVPRPATGHVDVLALDVGQGTSVLVRTAAHSLLYDTGPQYSRDSDAGERVLVPVLRHFGVTRLDRVVLSHRDLDHVGGAARLFAAVPVDSVWSSLEDGHPLLAAGPLPTRCAAGQHWAWDGVDFEVLHPTDDDYAVARKSNALSCVLRVRGTDGSVLLSGDIEREQEAALLATLGEGLRSDVLVVPHHGSKTSSTPAFLDAVRPQVAVIQAGYRNRFGHPAAVVLARYEARGIAVAASPACGAFHWPDHGAGPPDNARASSTCHRDLDRRYWHDEAGTPVDEESDLRAEAK